MQIFYGLPIKPDRRSSHDGEYYFYFERFVIMDCNFIYLFFVKIWEFVRNHGGEI